MMIMNIVKVSALNGGARSWLLLWIIRLPGKPIDSNGESGRKQLFEPAEPPIARRESRELQVLIQIDSQEEEEVGGCR